jgi:hypothetical protein
MWFVFVATKVRALQIGDDSTRFNAEWKLSQCHTQYHSATEPLHKFLLRIISFMQCST